MKLKTRLQILAKQGNKCALCEHSFDIEQDTMCLHKQSNTYLCRSCNLVISSCLALAGRLGGIATFIDHFARFVGRLEPDSTPEDDDTWLDEQGRRIDRDGNMYDDKGIVLGNIHDGE